jgi:hypothetical protein
VHPGVAGESNSNVPRKKRLAFFINMPRLTKNQRVSICLEYICKVNNAREVIPAALGRSLKTNVCLLNTLHEPG